RWDEIVVLAAALAVLIPIALTRAPALRVLQFGDDAATGLGVHAHRARAGIIAIAVALAAVGVAAAGPVAFVAFMAAPIARRIAGGGMALAPAALVGAVVVAAADLAGRHLLPGDIQVPAGVITGAVGAPYLLWLLATGDRRGRTA
ncbi:MAG: iron chelate uptake ABC transporter family permease subunit, partial [Miltoncostaeaceae bacterium]